MKIEVIQADIDSGIKKSYTKCPIALALKRHFKKVKVKNYFITLDENIFIMGQALQLFTVNFDNGDPTEPFTFRIDHSFNISPISEIGVIS